MSDWIDTYLVPCIVLIYGVQLRYSRPFSWLAAHEAKPVWCPGQQLEVQTDAITSAGGIHETFMDSTDTSRKPQLHQSRPLSCRLNSHSSIFPTAVASDRPSVSRVAGSTRPTRGQLGGRLARVPDRPGPGRRPRPRPDAAAALWSLISRRCRDESE